MTIEISLEEFIKTVIRCLKESKIDYVLVGGVAVLIYGRPRTTVDVDIVIDSTNFEDINRLEMLLKQEGFIFQENEIAEAVKQNSHCSIYLKDYIYRIDVQGTYSSLNYRCLNNKVLMKIYDQDTYIQKAEDLIIAKLVYGSPQDYEDIHAILLRQKDQLDFAYLRRAARNEEVETPLDKVLSNLKF